MVSIAVSGDAKENETITLEADLTIPHNDNTKDIVLFAHGSGSSRHSPRNRYVAEYLQKDGLFSCQINIEQLS